MKIKIDPVIKVNQNGNMFYIGRLKLAELIKCTDIFTRTKSYDKSTYNAFNAIDEIIGNNSLAEDEAAFGTQRRQNENRLKQIAHYIEKDNGFFPNSLIVSLDPIIKIKESEGSFDSIAFDDIIKIENNSIEFDNTKVKMKLIDGQHRFYGFKYIQDQNVLKKISENFELILTIFINLPYSEQADLFATINSTQKPVNKSILTDLKALRYDKYKKLHFSNALAKWFNERSNVKRSLNLWKGKINMLGVGNGIISQGMFVETLSRLISNDKDTRKGILYNFFKNKEYDKVYFVLKEYFSAYEVSFKTEWGSKKHILCKTIGFIAIIKIFELLYVEYGELKIGTFENFVYNKISIFKKSSKYSKVFFTNKKFGSSLSESNKMRDTILDSFYSKTEIVRLRKLLRSYKSKIEK